MVISWTDSTPHTSGNYLILRTVGSQVQYDDLQANEVALSYLHSDHLGSNSLMTDASGAVVPNSQAAYLPFGDWRTEPATSTLTDLGYTGHRHNNTANNDLGLIYMNARYYVPGVGRFASADTIVPEPINPQSHNRYSYVDNRPIIMLDPSGHNGCTMGYIPSCSSDGLPAGQTPELQEALVVAGQESGLTALSIVCEPCDWYLALSDGFQWYDAIGMLPFVPATVGRYADDVAGFVGRSLAQFVERNGSEILQNVHFVSLSQVGRFRPFTRSNFRTNLARLTGFAPKGFDAHHVLPHKFIEDFSAIGFDIDDPIFGAWWEATPHRRNSYAYNADWARFFESYRELGRLPTQEEVLDFAKELAEEYGFDINF